MRGEEQSTSGEKSNSKRARIEISARARGASEEKQANARHH